MVKQKSSPLDDIRPERWTSRFTTALFDAIIASDCFGAGELPAVPEFMRSPKKAKSPSAGLFDFEE
jgi:hypothetical protein